MLQKLITVTVLTSLSSCRLWPSRLAKHQCRWFHWSSPCQEVCCPHAQAWFCTTHSQQDNVLWAVLLCIWWFQGSCQFTSNRWAFRNIPLYISRSQHNTVLELCSQCNYLYVRFNSSIFVVNLLVSRYSSYSSWWGGVCVGWVWVGVCVCVWL